MATHRNFYPVFIVCAIISFLCFLGWSAMRAADSGPEVTDADYYSKGLRYTSTLLEKKAAETLGWTISTELTGHALIFTLKDKHGQPVKQASGVLDLFLSDKGKSVSYPLQEVAEGVYLLNLQDSMTGEISARLEFRHNGARLSRQLLLNL